MEIWQVWGVIGILLIIIEMFTPVLFFLNLAIAAIVTGVLSYYVSMSSTAQVLTFSVLSIIFIAFLRPMLLKIKDTPENTGMDTYLGQSAKVIQKITSDAGRITVFGEAWDARSANGEEIDEGETVKIVSRDGLILFVEKNTGE